MLKTLMRQIKEYKTVSILTPTFAALEVLMEVLIPFTTASLIDQGINAGNMGEILKSGLFMILLAFLSLFFGVAAAKTAAKASAGFAYNLRDAMYETVQTFSFSNIDKFSTAGLITRMTTDVSNIQNAFQMILRIAVRAPLTMICSMVMCFVINHELSLIFLGAVAVLALAGVYVCQQLLHRSDIALVAAWMGTVCDMAVRMTLMMKRYRSEKWHHIKV